MRKPEPNDSSNAPNLKVSLTDRLAAIDSGDLFKFERKQKLMYLKFFLDCQKIITIFYILDKSKQY